MRRDDERLIDVRDAARAARRFIKGRRAEDVASDELLAAAQGFGSGGRRSLGRG